MIKINKWPKIDGCDFYLCGGAVRDHLLGRENKDNDFVVITDKLFDTLVADLEASGYEIFEIKPEFLTIRCRTPDGDVIDIAFPRKEAQYKDNRRPSVVTRANTLREDSSRRDFTMNALYMRNDGHIIDYYTGIADIEKGIIRAVGNAKDRIREDYLRILRAFRFACKYDMEIEPTLLEAMQRNLSALEFASAERVREELNMAFRFDSDRMVNVMAFWGLESIIKKIGLRIEVTSKK